MKHPLTCFALLSAFALSSGACATNAASDDTVPDIDAGHLDAKLDSRANPDGKTNPDGGGGKCPDQCTSDQDCQNACPDPGAGGLNCCDSQTGICYVESSSVCPSPPDASTGG